MNANQEIKHVVLLMMENHSFDQMLGCLQSEYSDLDGVDINSTSPRFNLDLSGNKVYQAPTDVQQVPLDPNHDTDHVLEQIADANSGFVRDFQKSQPKNTAQDCQYVMGYYMTDRLPALHELGKNFTVCDHWFSSLPGPTWPNRFFVLSGTSSGRVLMPEGIRNLRPEEVLVQDQITLFDRLNEAQVPWCIYYYDFPSLLLMNHQRRPENLARYRSIQKFFTEVTDEKQFPPFVFIEPKYFGVDQNDDHPPHNVFKAEKLIADVYNAIRSSPDLWRSTLLVILYNEHGGFYDHVAPPAAVSPDDHREEWTFDRLGVRVPAILVSPWVKKGVEKTVFDHTSLLKYLIDKWGLNSLGKRTEAANSIGVALNQETPREDTVPFIRVPYTNLVPDNPYLEKDDSNKHQTSLQAFALLLANTMDQGSTYLVADLARVAGFWVNAKTGLGRLFHRIGNLLTKESESIKQKKMRATSEVARKLVDQAENRPAPTIPTSS